MIIRRSFSYSFDVGKSIEVSRLVCGYPKVNHSCKEAVPNEL